jgi:hypothetical protein
VKERKNEKNAFMHLVYFTAITPRHIHRIRARTYGDRLAANCGQFYQYIVGNATQFVSYLAIDYNFIFVLNNSCN